MDIIQNLNGCEYMDKQVTKTIIGMKKDMDIAEKYEKYIQNMDNDWEAISRDTSLSDDFICVYKYKLNWNVMLFYHHISKQMYSMYLELKKEGKKFRSEIVIGHRQIDDNKYIPYYHTGSVIDY